MKLADMSFENSRNAEMQILPEIEKIMDDKEISGLFDELYSSKTDKASNVKRVSASRSLVSRLVNVHYDSVCSILSIMNSTDIASIKSQTRGEANAQITDLLTDADLTSFFMSPEALVLAAQSAISQK